MLAQRHLGSTRNRRKRRGPRAAELSIDQILRWADAYHKRCGRWPRKHSGRIAGSLGETWLAIDSALRVRGRGLSYRSSLAQLLYEQRGVRTRARLPPYSIPKILRWADAHQERTGHWPQVLSGPVLDAPGETWCAVHKALVHGRRKLPGGSSLAKLLAQERGVRNPQALPRFSVKQILAWADAHYQRTERWPTGRSGPVLSDPAETWSEVDYALMGGYRGLEGGSSLARLLAKHRGVRNRADLPGLSVKKILQWADAHIARTGRWPRHVSGPIAEAPGETWSAVEAALKDGLRLLPGGSSLYKLLKKYREGGRNRKH